MPQNEMLKNIIREIKFKRGITQKQIAEQLEVQPTYLSDAINGRVPYSGNLKDKIYELYSDCISNNIEPREETPIVAENLNVISTGKVIPYYDAEVAAGTAYGMEMTQTQPAGMIEIGGLMKDSEFAMRVYGNSMVPNYPAGCVIGLRQYTEHFIEPGTVYVVETSENRFLKRLYYNKDKSAFRCLSDNHMKHESGPMTGEYFYPEFEIPFGDVRRLLRVTGVIKRNIL